MFTGIIETIGNVREIIIQGTNKVLSISAEITPELKVDQSISHNGACLTVTHIEDDYYQVTAIEETLLRSNLGELRVGDLVNLERSMLLSSRLDGHIVQGHVDCISSCLSVEVMDGSWIYRFSYEAKFASLLVKKGSITVNGVSLTIQDLMDDSFAVAIIPYTYDHTNFHQIKKDSFVNLEFDILGKYVLRQNTLKI